MIVGMLIGFGLILGLAALTVDVGSINAERRTLQNAADAAAMSVARTCVDTGTCPAADDTELVDLVNLNDVKDNHTKIARVDGLDAICGNITTDESLPDCPPLEPGLYDCPTPQEPPEQYIRVYTQTQNSDDSEDEILPPFFGQAVVGGYQGVTQQTCASVGIGSLGSSHALPVVVAQCAYAAMMAKNESDFPPPPPPPGASKTDPVALPPGYAQYVTSVLTHTVAGHAVPPKCDYDSRSGLYVSGGFGWTLTDGNTCSADFTYDRGTWTMPVGNGAATPTGCRQNGTSPKDYIGTITHIPIMTGISADGNSYEIDGLAGFYVAGYNAPAADPKFWDGYNGDGALALRGNDDGFWGWFTDDFVDTDDASFGTTTNPRGPTVLGNIG